MYLPNGNNQRKILTLIPFHLKRNKITPHLPKKPKKKKILAKIHKGTRLGRLSSTPDPRLPKAVWPLRMKSRTLFYEFPLSVADVFPRIPIRKCKIRHPLSAIFSRGKAEPWLTPPAQNVPPIFVGSQENLLKCRASQPFCF